MSQSARATAVAAVLLILGGCATNMPQTSSIEAGAEGEGANKPANAQFIPQPLSAPEQSPPDPAAQAPSAPLDPSAQASPPSGPAGEAQPVAAGPALRALTGPEADEDSARASLWERLRSGFAMNNLDSELVRRWESWYASRPDYVARMMQRAQRYLFHIVEEVDKRALPMELALLPFVESAFNPQALSVARAAGMWQFMPATGREFELRQNLFRDDRRDVLASTKAALDYLQLLHRMFDDWHLALAAYNWGQGNVQRALERNRRSAQPMDYTALRMPEETRNYVPKLQAVKNIVFRPSEFGITLPALENHPFFLTVGINRDIDVEKAAMLAALPLDEFRMLNPQIDKPVILAAGTPKLLLPYDNANRFVREVEHHLGPLATWTAWVAPRNLKPSEAARLTGMSESALREINRIPAGMWVKAGSTLVVPRQSQDGADVDEHLAQNARLALLPEKSTRRSAKAAAPSNLKSKSLATARKSPAKSKGTGADRKATASAPQRANAR